MISQSPILPLGAFKSPILLTENLPVPALISPFLVKEMLPEVCFIIPSSIIHPSAFLPTNNTEVAIGLKLLIKLQWVVSLGAIASLEPVIVWDLIH